MGKPQTILICGDHKCVNKAEAEQYFKENLSLEVQIITKDKQASYNLVDLNLANEERNIKVIKNKNKKEVKTKKKIEIDTTSSNNSTDICLKLEKCDIDSIAKYLIKESNEKDYPNISLRE